MKWIKIEEKLPPKNTLVWVKRLSNKIENAPIYLAMRNSCEISTNIDPSKNCYWYGINGKEINKEQESTNNFKLTNSFSDVTVVEWTFVDFP
jgi:hypothetical protein